MSVEYWSQQPATVDGVMGGYGRLDGVDLQGSRQFLGYVERRLSKWKYPIKHRRAVDVGGGVGRVAVGLLSSLYASVTLYEPVESLLAQAERVLPGKCVRATVDEVNLTQGDVDLVWMQWVAMYLTDEALTAALIRWRTQLAAQPPGVGTPVIVIKDNLARRRERDERDNSIVRTEEEWLAVFENAGLRVLHALVQAKWPQHLHDVVMYALAAVD